MGNHVYNVTLKWKKNRLGVISSPELETAIEVATPPNFNHGIPNIWSPEHLFTAAVNSCYMTTFLSIAENSKLGFVSFSCNAKGILDSVDGKFLMTEVQLFPQLQINDEKDLEKAMRILQKTEAACLISNSVKAKVSLYPEIKVAEGVF